MPACSIYWSALVTSGRMSRPRPGRLVARARSVGGGTAHWCPRCQRVPRDRQRRRNLTLDDADRAEPRHPARQARALDDVDDPLDVLVGEGSFLGEPLVRRRANDDAPLLKLPTELG